MDKNEKNIAKLYGIYNFNAFSEQDVFSQAKVISFCVGFISFLFIMFLLSKYLLPSGRFAQFYLGAVYFCASGLLFGWLTESYNRALARINADHLLSNFDLEKDGLQAIAKEDIEKNGYLVFSTKLV